MGLIESMSLIKRWGTCGHGPDELPDCNGAAREEPCAAIDLIGWSATEMHARRHVQEACAGGV